jgi:superfamily II DNA or RNA helicase
MKLRPYQTTAVEFLLPRQRGFIVAPAGSGKTIMAASAAARTAKAFDRVVWLANTREQCEQARAACLRCLWPDPIAIDVHCVAARPDVTGATIIIIDEAHHTPANSWWSTIVGASPDCKIWGFSATPWTGDWERDGVLKAVFGEDGFHVVPRPEVMAGGSITQGIVVAHDLDQDGEYDEGEPVTISDSSGSYEITGLAPSPNAYRVLPVLWPERGVATPRQHDVVLRS